MKNIVFAIVVLVGFISNAQFSYTKRYLLGTFHEHDVTINGIALGAFPDIDVDKPYVKTNGFRFEALGLGFFAPIGNGSRITGAKMFDIKTNYSNYEFGEIVNGINLSTTGTIGDICFNGITIGGIAQFGVINNGIAIAGVWNSMEKSNGLQVAMLLNETLYSNGLQIALNNTSLYTNGIQVGGIGNDTKSMNGIQIGAQNISEKTYGIQVGGINQSSEIIGLQLGIFNNGRKTKGFQIGLWNENEKRKLPFINWNF